MPSEGSHILALEVRHSRIGYALFSGPEQLLDWGASTVPSHCDNRAERIRQRMAQLLNHFSPACIVVRPQRLMNLPRNANGVPILIGIRLAAKEYGIPIRVLGGDEIKSAFSIFRARTKEEIAQAIVGVFPELLARLPRERKEWQSEAHGMIVFDAIATGIAFWQRSPPRK